MRRATSSPLQERASVTQSLDLHRVSATPPRVSRTTIVDREVTDHLVAGGNFVKDTSKSGTDTIGLTEAEKKEQAKQ